MEFIVQVERLVFCRDKRGGKHSLWSRCLWVGRSGGVWLWQFFSESFNFLSELGSKVSRWEQRWDKGCWRLRREDGHLQKGGQVSGQGNVTARWHEDPEEVMKLNYVKTVSVGCMIFSSHVQLSGTVQRWIAGFANGVLQSRGHAPWIFLFIFFNIKIYIFNIKISLVPDLLNWLNKLVMGCDPVFENH